MVFHSSEANFQYTQTKENEREDRERWEEGERGGEKVESGHIKDSEYMYYTKLWLAKMPIDLKYPIYCAGAF